MNKRIFKFLSLPFLAMCLVSCVTSRQVAYLQDMSHGSQIELENRFEAVISPYDELDIMISCPDNELAAPFNLRQSTGMGNGMRNVNYLVDQNGNIELPVLGTIRAAGLTRLRLQDLIRKKLEDGGYLVDPYVMVRFQNFKVFFLGSNGGKAITVTNERCTFLEALALSGDLNLYTDRSKIAVVREVNGRMVMRYLDPRSSAVFDDPFFMLQQNDFIITRDTAFRNFMSSQQQISPVMSFFTTIASFGSLIASIVLLVK